MIICVCQGINDRTLLGAIRAGCRSVRQLRRATGAGDVCGNCACDLRRMIGESQDLTRISATSGPAAASLR